MCASRLCLAGPLQMPISGRCVSSSLVHQMHRYRTRIGAVRDSSARLAFPWCVWSCHTLLGISLFVSRGLPGGGAQNEDVGPALLAGAEVRPERWPYPSLDEGATEILSAGSPAGRQDPGRPPSTGGLQTYCIAGIRAALEKNQALRLMERRPTADEPADVIPSLWVHPRALGGSWGRGGWGGRRGAGKGGVFFEFISMTSSSACGAGRRWPPVYPEPSPPSSV